jgi:hypothetical protein
MHEMSFINCPLDEMLLDEHVEEDKIVSSRTSAILNLVFFVLLSPFNYILGQYFGYATTASFQIRSNWFITHPTIRCCAIWYCQHRKVLPPPQGGMIDPQQILVDFSFQLYLFTIKPSSQMSLHWLSHGIRKTFNQFCWNLVWETPSEITGKFCFSAIFVHNKA